MVGADHGECGRGFVLGERGEDGRGKVDGDADPFLRSNSSSSAFSRRSHSGRLASTSSFCFVLMPLKTLCSSASASLAAVGKALPMLHVFGVGKVVDALDLELRRFVELLLERLGERAAHLAAALCAVLPPVRMRMAVFASSHAFGGAWPWRAAGVRVSRLRACRSVPAGSIVDGRMSWSPPVTGPSR